MEKHGASACANACGVWLPAEPTHRLGEKKKERLGKRTASGVSDGWTRVPSNRKRTEVRAFPWRSQKAVMSFSSLVLRLILKKTSLLLSVTLMLRCSVGGCSLPPPPLPVAPGAPFSLSPDIVSEGGGERERGVSDGR